jgi:hypothetical protein
MRGEHQDSSMRVGVSGASEMRGDGLQQVEKKQVNQRFSPGAKGHLFWWRWRHIVLHNLG